MSSNLEVGQPGYCILALFYPSEQRSAHILGVMFSAHHTFHIPHCATTKEVLQHT